MSDCFSQWFVIPSHPLLANGGPSNFDFNDVVLRDNWDKIFLALVVVPPSAQGPLRRKDRRKPGRNNMIWSFVAGYFRETTVHGFR